VHLHDRFIVQLSLPGCSILVVGDFCDEYVGVNDSGKVSEGSHAQFGSGVVRVTFDVVGSGTSVLSLGHYDPAFLDFSVFLDDVSFTITTS
jgi:hypothetical protein